MFTVTRGKKILEVSHRIVKAPKPDGRKKLEKAKNDFCEIIFYRHGDVGYFINGIRYDISSQALVYIPRGVERAELMQYGQIYDKYVFKFDRKLLPKSHECALFYSPFIISKSTDLELSGYFERLESANEHYTRDEFWQVIEATLTELLLHLAYLAREDGGFSEIENPLVDRIKEIVEEFYESPIDEKFIESKLLLPKNYFGNIFKAAEKLTVKQYIIKRRMLEAKKDILSGISTDIVREKYGYSTYSSFNDHYSKYNEESASKTFLAYLDKKRNGDG